METILGKCSEWAAIYALASLLAKGEMAWGNEALKEEHSTPILRIIRHDREGRATCYTPMGDEAGTIDICTPQGSQRADAACCTELAKAIKEACIANSEKLFEIPEMGNTLSLLGISDPLADSPEMGDFTVICKSDKMLYEVAIPLSVKSIPTGYSLLAANRAGNLKYDIQQVKFANPEANKINRIDGVNEVYNRLCEILRLGGKLRFTNPESKFFLDNLCMVDLHFPRLIAEVVRIFYIEGISSIAELTEEVKRSNPYKIKEELITKNNFYEYKIKQFLYALAAGMKPSSIYRGYGHPLSHLVIRNNWKMVAFDVCDKKLFEQYLFDHAHLVVANCDAHKFGYIEKENGQWLIKLNLQITF